MSVDDSDITVTDLSSAVRLGRLEGLRALRDCLADEIAAGPAGKVSQTAALGRQLREALREIAELEKLRPRKSVVDDLAAKRTARRADSTGSGAAVGDGL